MVNSSLSEKMSLFFMEPRSPDVLADSDVKVYSQMYLLRKHVKICLCIDTPSNKAQAIWPATMAILSGIDLLGLFYRGGKIVGETNFHMTRKDHFKEFCGEFLEITDGADQETIYMLRNAFLHTYGLKTINMKGKIYEFIVDYKESIPFLLQLVNGKYWINLHNLHKRFEYAIRKYHDSLVNGKSDKQIFEDVYKQFREMEYNA